VRIHENDREGLERLCRYAMRPPLALHRLTAGPDGNLVYRMKRPRGGSLSLVLTPDQLLARLATLVPPPRTHALRYHGLFAPHCKDRGKVVSAGARRPHGHAAATPAGEGRESPPRVYATQGGDRPARR
jgi:hypothetical protein